MRNASHPDLTLFLDILRKLEALEVPYVVIGGFAATMYGITRATYDIDIILDMEEGHIQALADAYPLPRYYADPHQMKNAVDLGTSFNIIDTTRGEKADLFPLSMDNRYRPAFENRVRRVVDLADREPFSIWTARPEDVIVGKLMAWNEGHSDRHLSDIFEMMLVQYLSVDNEPAFDEEYVDVRAAEIGGEARKEWEDIKKLASEESQRN